MGARRVDKCSSLLSLGWKILESTLYISQVSRCNGSTFAQQPSWQHTFYYHLLLSPTLTIPLLFPRIISQVNYLHQNSCLIWGEPKLKQRHFPETKDQILLPQTSMSLHMAGEIRRTRLELSGCDSPILLLGSCYQMASWHREFTSFTHWSWKAPWLHFHLLAPTCLCFYCVDTRLWPLTVLRRNDL